MLALYRAGKVDRILVSGDHGKLGYAAPGAMTRALLAAGVPASAIFSGHAGFDTWSTVVRARSTFGVSDAILVTQDFHVARAPYLASVKSVGQGTVHPAVLGGPPHPIGGDGRQSWAPPDPLAA